MESNLVPIKRRNGQLTRSLSTEQPEVQYTAPHESRSVAESSGRDRDRGGVVKMFRVLVDPPSAGTFFSGSEVRGHVEVDTDEEKKFKYIHVSLTGRAEVW